MAIKLSPITIYYNINCLNTPKTKTNVTIVLFYVIWLLISCRRGLWLLYKIKTINLSSSRVYLYHYYQEVVVQSLSHSLLVSLPRERAMVINCPRLLNNIRPFNNTLNNQPINRGCFNQCK